MTVTPARSRSPSARNGPSPGVLSTTTTAAHEASAASTTAVSRSSGWKAVAIAAMVGIEPS
jgi:hypothetical protein